MNIKRTQNTSRKGNLLHPQHQLRELALSKFSGFADVMALVRDFSESELGTPLNDGKCREKTASLLGYSKYSLFLKDYKAKHALRAAINNLKLEELRLKLDEIYRNEIEMYPTYFINSSQNPIDKQLGEVYLEWTKRLSEVTKRRCIQADAEAMTDYLSQLCGVAPRVIINETQFFEQCNPEQFALDHIRRHGLFLSPRNQGEGSLNDYQKYDYKVAISPGVAFLHLSKANKSIALGKDDRTWKLLIKATSPDALTLSAVQIALNQIHLLCPSLEQCYILPESAPEVLTQLFEREPTCLQLTYTVPEHGEEPKPVKFDIASPLMFRVLKNHGRGILNDVDIEPQPLPLNTARLQWEDAHIKPGYPILD